MFGPYPGGAINIVHPFFPRLGVFSLVAKLTDRNHAIYGPIQRQFTP